VSGFLPRKRSPTSHRDRASKQKIPFEIFFFAIRICFGF
jgi:hypothetical protein